MSLIDAISENDEKQVKAMLKKDKKIAQASQKGIPLIVATEQGVGTVVKLLLKHGADTKVKDREGRTPLLIACEENQYEIVVTLLKYNADPKTHCYLGNTPLHAAAVQDNVKMILLLLNNGSDINSINDDGWTALHSASTLNKMSAVKCLLMESADITVKDNRNLSAYDVAVQLRFYNLAHILRSHDKRRLREHKRGYKKSKQSKSKNKRRKSIIQQLFQSSKTQKVEVFCDDELVTTMTYREIERRESSIVTVDESYNENECPICYELPTLKVRFYQCTNGHVYCGECRQDPDRCFCLDYDNTNDEERII